MRQGWLTKVGPYRVEHVPYSYLGAHVALSAPAKGLLHTTEGATIEGALSVFRQHYAPNFTVGPDTHKKIRVLQHAPLGVMGHALANKSGGVETNRVVRAQIEIVGFSVLDRKWLPAEPTLAALVELMFALEEACDIPRRHVDVGRDSHLWDAASGWVGHRDAPENDHVDPGLFNYKAVFTRMALVADPPLAKTQPKPRAVDKATTLPLRARARGATPASCHVTDGRTP